MKKYIWGINKTISKDPEVRERLSHLSDIKFAYIGENPIPDHYVCAKIYIGRKFYIVKTKTIQWLEMHLNKLLKAYNSDGMDSKDLYFPVVKQIHNTGYYDVNVEILKQSTNPYEVIKSELITLYESRENSLLLNKNKFPYIPKYNPKTKMYGWLTINQFLNYKKLYNKFYG